MRKLKFGSLELSQIKQEVEKFKDYKLLNEVIKYRVDYYYTDSIGKHKLPDLATADFLKSSKGIIEVKRKEFNTLIESNPFESVSTAKLVKVKDQNSSHYFVILNDKSYYINSWGIILNWGKSDSNFELIPKDEFQKYSVGR